MKPWKPVSKLQAFSLAAACILATWLRESNSDRWIRVLDDANLIFHEAGHPIFGLLGSTLGLYGGTLGQLTFPAIAASIFWRQEEPVSFAFCLAWFFENFLNIGRYMADARTQILPLVGGGEHDWTTIFTRWGVLRYDTVIAGLVSAAGWAGMIGCTLWLFYLNSYNNSDTPH